MSDVMIALLLTTFAGLSTVLGAVIAILIKKPGKNFLPLTLGFSGGVMIYISFMEMLPLALETVSEELAILAFFIGMGFIAFIDMLIPQKENPHNFTGIEKIQAKKIGGIKPALIRTGYFTALVIGIHNFPEGIATFATALTDINLGIVIAIAIAIHNIPEGLSVYVPIFYATGSKKTAFKFTFLSGIAEPIGAIIAYLILMPFLNDSLLAMMLAFVAGIMVYISIDEIIPAAHSYGKSHVVIIGVVFGMLVMAVSLLML